MSCSFQSSSPQHFTNSQLKPDARESSKDLFWVLIKQISSSIMWKWNMQIKIFLFFYLFSLLYWKQSLDKFEGAMVQRCKRNEIWACNWCWARESIRGKSNAKTNWNRFHSWLGWFGIESNGRSSFTFPSIWKGIKNYDDMMTLKRCEMWKINSRKWYVKCPSIPRRFLEEKNDYLSIFLLCKIILLSGEYFKNILRHFNSQFKVKLLHLFCWPSKVATKNVPFGCQEFFRIILDSCVIFHVIVVVQFELDWTWNREIDEFVSSRW